MVKMPEISRILQAPLVVWLTRQGFVKVGLPQEVVTDYMEHTCHSFVSNTRQIIFHSNLVPALEVLGRHKPLLPVLLVYSRTDKDVPLRHGQEMAALLPGSQLVVLEDGTDHQVVGQVAKKLVREFLFQANTG